MVIMYRSAEPELSIESSEYSVFWVGVDLFCESAVALGHVATHGSKFFEGVSSAGSWRARGSPTESPQVRGAGVVPHS